MNTKKAKEFQAVSIDQSKTGIPIGPKTRVSGFHEYYA